MGCAARRHFSRREPARGEVDRQRKTNVGQVIEAVIVARKHVDAGRYLADLQILRQRVNCKILARRQRCNGEFFEKLTGQGSYAVRVRDFLSAAKPTALPGFVAL